MSTVVVGRSIEREESTVDTEHDPSPPRKFLSTNYFSYFAWQRHSMAYVLYAVYLHDALRGLGTGFSSPSHRIQRPGRTSTPPKCMNQPAKQRNAPTQQSKKSNLYLADFQAWTPGSDVHGRGGVFYRKKTSDRGHGPSLRKFLSTNYFFYFACHRHSMACERYAATCGGYGLAWLRNARLASRTRKPAQGTVALGNCSP